MRLQTVYFIAAVALTAVPLSAGAQSLSANDAGYTQSENPSGGNSMGLAGPNPGGPGLTPYSGGGYPAPYMATPPARHAVRHAKAMHVHRKAMVQKVALRGDAAAQLNREELARLQSGAPPAPPPFAPMSAALPSQPNPSGGNSMGMPGPNPGGPGLTPYTY